MGKTDHSFAILGIILEYRRESLKVRKKHKN